VCLSPLSLLSLSLPLYLLTHVWWVGGLSMGVISCSLPSSTDTAVITHHSSLYRWKHHTGHGSLPISTPAPALERPALLAHCSRSRAPPRPSASVCSSSIVPRSAAGRRAGVAPQTARLVWHRRVCRVSEANLASAARWLVALEAAPPP
jgi:hypothetical protein